MKLLSFQVPANNLFCFSSSVPKNSYNRGGREEEDDEEGRAERGKMEEEGERKEEEDGGEGGGRGGEEGKGKEKAIMHRHHFSPCNGLLHTWIIPSHIHSPHVK